MAESVDEAHARCPRCGGGFHCGASDREPCACATVTLDATTLAALRRRYDGCLCLACLAQIAEAVRTTGTMPA